MSNPPSGRRELMRVQPVPVRMARCAVCSHVANCNAYDHDLRGDICEEDFAFVHAAEIYLRKARLAIPRDSILDQ
jgi:hypothetical protein